MARTARDLENANVGDLIHVDAEGRVRSPVRARARQAAYWGLIGALLTVEAVLGYGALGTPGLGFALVLTLLVAWRVKKQVELQRATAALAARDYAEADRRFAKVAGARVLPRRFRPLAVGRRALAKEAAGDPEGALALCREALRLFGESRVPSTRLARYQEVRLLARLGRLDEASERLAALGPTPDGELFRLHHETLELHLAFLRGAHALSDEELHERAAFALGINLASPLLAALAWAFAQRGDEEMTELLREAAVDRDVDGAAARYPELFAWLTAGERPAVRVTLERGEREPSESRAELEAERAQRSNPTRKA